MSDIIDTLGGAIVMVSDQEKTGILYAKTRI